MENSEMAKAYIDAKEQRFVLQYEPFKCISDFEGFSCDECPAANSCNQLSQGKFSTFIRNFKTNILPLVNHESER